MVRGACSSRGWRRAGNVDGRHLSHGGSVILRGRGRQILHASRDKASTKEAPRGPAYRRSRSWPGGSISHEEWLTFRGTERFGDRLRTGVSASPNQWRGEWRMRGEKHGCDQQAHRQGQ
jgi:hypothetical protein